uniref:Tyrosine hydroxylase 2 n=1 Tax=Oncorhynchus kisutch TaxID=8019 RepID=A0A8C7KUN5_ONCKI
DSLRQIARSSTKTESVVQNIPFVGRERSLIEDARKEHASCSSSPDPSRGGENVVFEEKEGTVTLNILFALIYEKNAGFFKTGKVFETFESKLLHIERRPGRKSKNSGCDDLEFFMRCEVHISDTDIFINSLKRVADDNKITTNHLNFPWFPRKNRDLDKCNLLITKYDPDMDQDHPVSVYVYLSNIARLGEPLPRMDQYTCGQLERECGYGEDSIPQLREVSAFLREETGFQLCPVAGLLSARDFLASLAFRVFQCTHLINGHIHVVHVFICCCHDLLGHIPMLADKEFAQFSQEIGLASLGASDEDIETLNPLSFLHHLLSFLRQLYWFTVEFGLCKQNGTVKAYGAGLLSSYGELINALSNEPEYKPFNPEETAIQPYQDQTFQPLRKRYSSSIKRPFSVRYDPFTCSLEVLDQPSKIQHALGQMRDDLKILHSALEKLG